MTDTGEASPTPAGAAGRHVRVPPVNAAAAEVLAQWAAADADVTLDATHLDLSGADLSGADLCSALFCPSTARGTLLRKADLYRANLGWSDLTGAVLTGACLVKAELTETVLRDADLTGANLGSADLYAVDARGARLREARLDGASLLGATRLEGADLTGAGVARTSFQVVLDERTELRGLHGSIFGPAFVADHADHADHADRRQLAGLELELWLADRGATVEVLNSPADTTTYYARICEEFPRSNPAGIVRRRRAGTTVRDDAFTRNLRWEPTEYLRRYALGHNDVDHVEITPAEADAFVHRITRKHRAED
ncbi:pentapeptide repeat-containing protein [Streptomyces sp. NBC_01381]|uniref:pentapeptide repeat-containing protein n=1 Tax=Streptomyces sp. NBC_01381 TaxID=2903845 RepID=UPI00225BE430|nr:pentapeptide repeat-containing protein [Streptomyces sp. NBC_01381]MCX4673402.1 pentapeptide repeat-containing protein [Streptomyces sp. NBC_01381]